MNEVHYIVDLQFGSTGKGLLAGYLAEKHQPDTLITAWGPNAGHTFIDADGRKFVNIALPNGIVSKKLKRILIGPGSIINPDIMADEIARYADLLGKNVQIMIHPHAAVVTQAHRDIEASYGFKIGSTMKGVGEAVMQKLRRDPANQNIAEIALADTPLDKYVVTKKEYDWAMMDADVALVEGAQGYSLGINNGFYPYTTSRECTVAQLMVDCAIPRVFGTRGTWQTQVHGVARTFPIRVANRFDKDGNKIGTSGPCYPDQQEVTWEAIGQPVELTTVTKLPRRVFTLSVQQLMEAVQMNGVDDIFLNFLNYLPMEVRDAFIKKVSLAAPVRWGGYGPTVNDVSELT